jgi:hypothetical protein
MSQFCHNVDPLIGLAKDACRDQWVGHGARCDGPTRATSERMLVRGGVCARQDSNLRPSA